MDTAPHDEPGNAAPPPSGHTAPRRLYRYPDHGPCGGVCAGIGAYFSVDPTIVRLAAVALALAGPGVILYILAWIFVPAAPGTTPPAATSTARSERGTQVLGIILVIVAVSVFWGDWWLPGESFVLPVALIAIGAWLLLRGYDSDGDELPPPTRPTPQLADPTSDTWPAAATPPPSDPAETPDPAVRRRRRLVGPIVTGILLLWGGVASLAGVDLDDGLAVGLSIVGVGFVLGAFVGGSRILMVPAALIAAALVVTAMIDVPLSGGVGQRAWQPASADAVERAYHLGIGQGTLDLTAAAPGAGDTLEVEASVGIGHLIVEVPPDVTVILAGSASAGEIVFLGYSVDGIGVDQDRRDRGDPRNGTIALDLAVGLGQIEVVRA